LEAEGFIVDIYKNPVEALSRFIPNYYDLLLLDIQMPQLNGFELYDKIKEKDEKALICFLTAYDIDYSSDLKQRYTLPKEKDCFINKPIEIYKLKDLINEKIER
jgi:two-component system OmpR family response regulator